jgi:hypothetical protein
VIQHFTIHANLNPVSYSFSYVYFDVLVILIPKSVSLDYRVIS